MWQISYSNSKDIEKAVSKLRSSTQLAFYEAVKDMRVEGPSPKGWKVKRLSGNYKGCLSLRLDYRHRMVYKVEKGEMIIIIFEVYTRENAY